MHVLVAGAGPTGLTAALELARAGHRVDIVDRRPDASGLSRAIGISNRSLALLEPSGVTAALLAEGMRISTFVFREAGRPERRLSAAGIGGRWPFMLSLPQDRTEAILARALAACGVRVRYGTAFAGFGPSAGEVRLATRAGEETCRPDIVIGADGVHSTVRAALGIPFPGIELDEEWSVADFDAPDFDGRDAFVVHPRTDGRMVGRAPIGPGRFRAFSNTPEVLALLPGADRIARVREAGRFRIAIRQVAAYRKGPVFLAGDAAHCHSPVGGRGMNLGIEDAATLARAIAEQRTDAWAAERHATGRQVIALSERLRLMLLGRGAFGNLRRRAFLAGVSAVPALQRMLIRAVLETRAAA
jgi:2-polyprenyl-6-methoxyphenol hydroxylase-like FAD-dependent oxidoreductase